MVSYAWSLIVQGVGSLRVGKPEDPSAACRHGDRELAIGQLRVHLKRHPTGLRRQTGSRLDPEAIPHSRPGQHDAAAVAGDLQERILACPRQTGPVLRLISSGLRDERKILLEGIPDRY